MNVAASDAKLPVKVVSDLGTAVHRSPSIEVIENPAGRFDMAKGKATPVAERMPKSITQESNN